MHCLYFRWPCHILHETEDGGAMDVEETKPNVDDAKMEEGIFPSEVFFFSVLTILL